MKRGVAFLVPVLALALVVAASARTTKIVAFKTPTHNIVCTYLPAISGQKAFVECGIKSGLKPPPPKTGAACRHVDYVHDRIDLLSTGKAKPVACAGDPGALAYEKQAKVLGYGQTWHKGGFYCSSHVAGLTCTNTQSHGFFLSRARWKGF